MPSAAELTLTNLFAARLKLFGVSVNCKKVSAMDYPDHSILKFLTLFIKFRQIVLLE